MTPPKKTPAQSPASPKKSASPRKEEAGAKKSRAKASPASPKKRTSPKKPASPRKEEAGTKKSRAKASRAKPKTSAASQTSTPPQASQQPPSTGLIAPRPTLPSTTTPLTHKQALRTDAFQQLAARTIVWGKAHLKLLISSAVVMLMLGVGYAIYEARLSASLQRQGLELTKVETLLQDETKSEALRIADAQERLQDFVKQHPRSMLAPGAWMRIAGLAWRKNDVSMAEKAFGSVREHRQSDDLLRVLATVGLAKIHLRQNNLKKGADLLNTLPEDAHAEFKHYHLGQLALKQEKWGEAMLHF